MAETVEILRNPEQSLRQAFQDYENGIALANARRAAVIAAGFMLAGSALDLIKHPERAVEFLVIRATCAAVLCLIYWVLGRSKSWRTARVLAHGIALLPLVSFCVMISVTTGGNSPYYAGLNLVMVGLALLLGWSLSNSLLMIASCFVCYALSVWLSPVAPDLRVLFANCCFMFVTSVFVMAGGYFYENLRFNEFKLRTEVEKARELLEIKNQQLSELDEAKTRFFANISHELRTPLTVVLGITERLKSVVGSQSLNQDLREMVTMLEQNGLRLLKLIDDLLDLVQFDAGAPSVNRQPTHIQHHIDGLLRSLRHLAEQDKVALSWTCETDSESILIDRDKFDKILLNLVINAIKFTPSSGSITVAVGVLDGRLLLKVEDTGVGIQPEVLPRIFERFWQEDNSSTRKFQGAGIGLALVRNLTEAMDGSVTVSSQPGHGTIFNVVLPIPALETEQEAESTYVLPVEHGETIAQLHRKAAMSIPGRVEPEAASILQSEDRDSRPAIGRPSGARPLVLIADDEPDIRRFLRMQMENVDVIEACDGVEALDLVKRRNPQLALLDHMMPRMDGLEVCKVIRGNQSSRGTAVIVVTARADEQTKLAALEAGANDFLTKPFSTAELALRLENQIAIARVRREMADLNAELEAALEQIKENEVLMIRNEKLSALGRMSAGIIHEINNPLNYANAGIHALEGFTHKLPDAEVEDFIDILKDIREGVERVSQIVIDLRKFTRDDASVSGDADLAEIMTRARRMVSHQMGNGSMSLTLDVPEQAMIRGNSNQLVQVFINFFQNSIDAIQQRIVERGGDRGCIEASITAAGESWVVTVRDNGIGIPAENLAKIFDPFFTSKDVGKGMGLGLSITHQILQAHRAIVEVDSRPGEFTCFRLVFPKHED